MPGTIFGHIVAFLVLIVNPFLGGLGSPIIEYDKGLRYEEYMVEHEISAGQAKNAAISIDLTSVTSPAGCQKCTKDEIKYCLGIDLISDHCCCDRRYHEVLPFIPHTCYLGTQVCKPVFDCAEYSRLRSCCCDHYTLEKWKKKLAGAGNGAHKDTIVVTMISHFLLYIAVHYLWCY